MFQRNATNPTIEISRSLSRNGLFVVGDQPNAERREWSEPELRWAFMCDLRFVKYVCNCTAEVNPLA